MGLLGLHNHEPIAIINILYIHIYSTGSSSGESWPKQPVIPLWSSDPGGAQIHSNVERESGE